MSDTGWHRHDSGVVHRDADPCTWLGNPVPCDPPRGMFFAEIHALMRAGLSATEILAITEARKAERECSCGHVRDEHDAGIASCGMCPCEEWGPW